MHEEFRNPLLFDKNLKIDRIDMLLVASNCADSRIVSKPSSRHSAKSPDSAMQRNMKNGSFEQRPQGTLNAILKHDCFAMEMQDAF